MTNIILQLRNAGLPGPIYPGIQSRSIIGLRELLDNKLRNTGSESSPCHRSSPFGETGQ